VAERFAGRSEIGDGEFARGSKRYARRVAGEKGEITRCKQAD
jgi:hypothetical protein